MILEVGEFGFMAQQFDQLISYPPTIRIPLSTRTPVTFTPSKSIIYLGRTTWMSSMIWGCQALIVQPPCLFCVQKNAVQKCASRDSLNSTRDYQLISFFFRQSHGVQLFNQQKSQGCSMLKPPSREKSLLDHVQFKNVPSPVQLPHVYLVTAWINPHLRVFICQC